MRYRSKPVVIDAWLIKDIVDNYFGLEAQSPHVAQAIDNHILDVKPTYNYIRGEPQATDLLAKGEILTVFVDLKCQAVRCTTGIAYPQELQRLHILDSAFVALEGQHHLLVQLRGEQRHKGSARN